MIRTFYSRLEKDNRLYNYRGDLPEYLNTTDEIINSPTGEMMITGMMEKLKKLPDYQNMPEQRLKMVATNMVKGMVIPSMPLANIPSDKLAPRYDWDTSRYTLWGIEGKNSMAINDEHLLTFGAEYRQNKVEGTRMGEGGNNIHDVSQSGNGYTNTKQYSERDLNTWAAYLQDEWMPSEKWLIIPSVRYDHDGNFGGKMTPKIGATYFINNNSRIKANWGKGFKAPTVSELYMNMHRAMGSMMVNVYGNPDLEPEESTYWDISYETEIGKASGKLTYFNNDLDNMIGYKTLDNKPGTYGVSQQYINIDKASVDGVELTLGYKFNDNWRVKLMSNWLDAMDTGANERLEDRAKNTTTFIVDYDDNNPNGYSAMLWWQLVNKYWYGYTGADNKTAYDNATYGTLNFTVSKKFGENRRIFAGIDNALNKKIDDIGLIGRIWRIGTEWKI